MTNGLMHMKNIILNIISLIGLTFAGNFTAGHHHMSGGNAWVVQGFRDFKGAIGGHSKLPSKYSQKEHEKAWDNFLETSGGGKIVRSFLRIMLATY